MDAWDEILGFLATEHRYGRPHVPVLSLGRIRFNNNNADAARAVLYLIDDKLAAMGLKAGCISITKAGLAYHAIGETAL